MHPPAADRPRLYPLGSWRTVVTMQPAAVPAPTRRRLAGVGLLFDRLEAAFHSSGHRRLLASGLVGAYLLALGVIEVSSRGWLGQALKAALPRSHFHAVELAFYLLLSFEVASLVFAMAQSWSNAAGKQFEIFSLILLRRSFEAFANLDEPVHWETAQAVVLRMVADAGSALLLFVGLGFYYGMQKHLPLSEHLEDRDDFVLAKKVIALVLLVAFVVLAGQSLKDLVLLQPAGFFEAFYTVLIFADVLVVLISLRYNASHRVVFRNSGLAVATVLLRLALAAPPPWAGLLGVAAMVFALVLTLAYNRFTPQMDQPRHRS